MKRYFIYLSFFSVLLVFSACQDSSLSPDDSVQDGNSGLNKNGNSSGSALDFDGSGGFVLVPDDASLDMSDKVTITAWIYFNADSYPADYASIVTKGIEENNYTLHTINGGQFALTAGTATGGFQAVSDNAPLTPEVWHHVAATFQYDGTTQEIKFYIDGSEAGISSFGGTDPAPLSSNNEPLIIGADFPGGDEFWYGRIDEVRVWNDVLTRGNIRASMNDSRTRSSSLAGFWKFNEGSGTLAGDESGNNNDGTLIGAGVEFVSPGVH